ncbi:hypothetical protein O3M35_012987 [Rhynocoris fuscipes]|uniref:Uncharacterized protein n=1 Tax=Rhynocoris fuscipes TaxID=488301 RepID=A0AAW1CKN2_9HEMI
MECPRGTQKFEENLEQMEENYEQNSLKVCELSEDRKYMGSFHKQKIASVIARIPKELFYQYNPSCIEKPEARVVPLAFRQYRDEEESLLYSLETNKYLAEKWKTFKRALPLSDKPQLQLPTANNFHIINYHVIYSEPSVVSRKKKLVKY